MHPQTLITRRGGLMNAEIGQELVALDVDGGHCFGFNRTATTAWQLLEQPQRFGNLVAQMIRIHAVEPATCAAELDELIAGMETDGLVTLIFSQ